MEPEFPVPPSYPRCLPTKLLVYMLVDEKHTVSMQYGDYAFDFRANNGMFILYLRADHSMGMTVNAKQLKIAYRNFKKRCDWAYETFGKPYWRTWSIRGYDVV